VVVVLCRVKFAELLFEVALLFSVKAEEFLVADFVSALTLLALAALLTPELELFLLLECVEDTASVFPLTSAFLFLAEAFGAAEDVTLLPLSPL
jgi:hypothetical protein